MSTSIKYNIVTIGDSTVGKTCTILSLIKKPFQDNHMLTLGFEKTKVERVKDDITYNFDIWDTIGQERYTSLGTAYFKKAQGIVLVFDVTFPESFTNVKKWLKLAQGNAGNYPSGNNPETNRKTPQYILFGNKCDKTDERKITKEQGEELAKELGTVFYETSAKTGEGIQEGFEYLFDAIIKEYGKMDKKSVKIGKEKSNNKICC